MAGLSVLLGCTDGSGIPECVPVSGIVSLDGKPLTDGNVIFRGTAPGGGPLPYEPIGMIGPHGEYSLITRHKPGAPVGQYRVLVYWDEPGAGWQKPKSRLPAKYSDDRKTPLAVEVVAHPAPGAYDLKMTSP
jgi:hypothetical protein